MCMQKTSGYINSGKRKPCGCEGEKSKVQGRTSQVERSETLDQRPLTSDEGPKNETEKDIKEEAQKYSNTEVPGYNKVFGITLLIVTLMVVSGEN